MQRHDDFLQSGVSGPFTNAVDSALHLLRSGADGCQGIGYGHSHVVMAVDGQPGAAHIGNIGFQVGNQAVVFLRHRVTHRIRNVDDGGARINHGFHHFRQEFRLRSGGVLRGELHFPA